MSDNRTPSEIDDEIRGRFERLDNRHGTAQGRAKMYHEYLTNRCSDIPGPLMNILLEFGEWCEQHGYTRREMEER